MKAKQRRLLHHSHCLSLSLSAKSPLPRRNFGVLSTGTLFSVAVTRRSPLLPLRGSHDTYRKLTPASSVSRPPASAGALGESGSREEASPSPSSRCHRAVALSLRRVLSPNEVAGGEKASSFSSGYLTSKSSRPVVLVAAARRGLTGFENSGQRR